MWMVRASGILLGFFMRKSAKQNGGGKIKSGNAATSGKQCESGMKEAAATWRTRGMSRIRMKQKALLRQTNRILIINK